MKTVRLLRLAAVTLFTGMLGHAAAGCSSSSDSSNPLAGTADLCTFARAPDNCWRSTLAAIDACIGTASTTGKLSADGKTCTSTDGSVVVTFTTAPDLTLKFEDRARDFTLTVGGKTCMKAHQANGAKNLQLSGPDGKTLDATATGTIEVVTCADGKKYGADVTTFLDKCADQLLGGGLPGTSGSGTATSDSFRFFGGKSPGYNCSL